MQSIQLLAASLLLLVFLSAASDQRLRVTLFEESAVGTPVGTSLSNLLGASGGTGSGGGPSVPSCPGGSRRVFSFSSEPLNPFLTDRFSLSEAGQLAVAKRVDREELLCGRLPPGGGRECCRAEVDECTLTLNVRVACVGAGATTGSEMTLVDVALMLKDTNDNHPEFPAPGAVFEERPENLPPTSDQAAIYLPLAIDLDGPAQSIKGYRLREGAGLTSNALFNLVYTPQAANPSRRLYLVPKQPLDHELAAVHFLQVVAEERVPLPPHASGAGSVPQNILNVTVSVRDENDNPPVFSRPRYPLNLSENTLPDSSHPVLEIVATDRDSGLNGELRFELTQTSGGGAATDFEAGSPFSLSYSKNVASLMLERPLDFERTRDYHFIITARDNSDTPKSADASVDVHVTNENDNAPEIKFEYLTSERTLEVEEGRMEPSTLAFIVVTDPDWTTPADQRRIECSAEPSDRFELVLQSGAGTKVQYRVQTARGRPFDREANAQVSLHIRCTDPDSPALVGEAHANVQVIDINDNPPRFENSTYLVRIAENNDPSIPILEARANDSDVGENARVEYYLQQSDRAQFSINATDGRLFSLHPFDRERESRYELRIFARNPGKAGFTATATVSIEVLDVNDNAPALPPVVEFAVEENKDPRAYPYVGKLEAADPDYGENGRVEYALADAEGSALFQVGHSSGELHLKRALDRELTPVHEFRVVASDAGTPKLSSTATVRIRVRDVNDNAPEITVPQENEIAAFRVNAQAPEQSFIGKVEAHDKDEGPNAQLVYSIARVMLNNRDVTRFQYFVLHPRTGELTVGTKFPANPFTGASQDSFRQGHQPRADTSHYLHDEYQLDIRVNDSASAVAGGPAGASRETAKSTSRKFFVRVEYGGGGAIAPRENDAAAVSGGPFDSFIHLLASHGLKVLLVLGLACFLLVLLVGSLLVLYCSHASSSPDRSKRGSLDEERRERDGLLHACVACLLCLRCPSCLCFCCRRRRREKSPATVQQAADATDVALVTLESGEHVPRTKTPALERVPKVLVSQQQCGARRGSRPYRGVPADDTSSSAVQDDPLPHYSHHQHRRRRHARAESRGPAPANSVPEETFTENSNYAEQNTSHGGSEADDSHNYAEYAELYYGVADAAIKHPSLRRTHSSRSASVPGNGAVAAVAGGKAVPGTFAGRGHYGRRPRRSTRDGPARSFQPPDIPEGGSSIVESDAAVVPQVVVCEVYPYDRSRSGRNSAAPGANNNFSDSLSQAADSELQSIGIGVESAGQTAAQIPLVMRTSSAFSPYNSAALQDPNNIRPYHTTFVPVGLDQQLLKPIPQRAGDVVYGVSPMFLSGVGAQQQFAYPSAAAVQIPVPMPALYSDVPPQDPRALWLARQMLQQQQMQGSMHAAMPGLQSLASGQQALALPLHVVPAMAAAAAHNVQQLPGGSSATDTLNQSHLYAYCFGTNAQPNQQSQIEAMATPRAVSQLRSEDGIRSATASPTRTLPSRERVYGIVKGSRV